VFFFESNDLQIKFKNQKKKKKKKTEGAEERAGGKDMSS